MPVRDLLKDVKLPYQNLATVAGLCVLQKDDYRTPKSAHVVEQVLMKTSSALKKSVARTLVVLTNGLLGSHANDNKYFQGNAYEI